MLKNCDECGATFDVFNEGKVSDYNNVWCGNCWKIEWKLRGNK
jgi:hypothetical protein